MTTPDAKPVTRWFLDTEFNEDGRTIELISIALVSDDGREYYAVSADFDPAACNDWVKENVLPHLPIERRYRRDIADEVRELLLADSKKPEVWAYFADYDWVALCQLFGPMIALPKGFPMLCMDLKQLMKSEGIEKDALPKQVGTAHDALADARWVRDAHRAISTLRASRAPVEPGVVTGEGGALIADLYAARSVVESGVSLGDAVAQARSAIPHRCSTGGCSRPAQVCKPCGARGAARATPPGELTAEVERLKGELKYWMAKASRRGKNLVDYMAAEQADRAARAPAEWTDNLNFTPVEPTPPGEDVAGLLDDADALEDIADVRRELKHWSCVVAVAALDRIESFIRRGAR